MSRLANFISTRPGLLWRKTADLEVKGVNTALSIQLMLFWDMSNTSHPLDTLSPPPHHTSLNDTAYVLDFYK